MADFQEIEQDAKNHSKQVDEVIDKVKETADQEAGGKDRGLIDKGAEAIEKELGGAPDGTKPDGTSPM